MAKKQKTAAKYLLSVNGVQRAERVKSVCEKLAGQEKTVLAQCMREFKAEFPTLAHLKQKAHALAFGRALRNADNSTTRAYIYFTDFAKAYKGSGGKLPWKPNAKGGQGVTPGKWINALHEKMDSLTRSVEQASKADIISIDLLRQFTAAVKAVNAMRKALDAEIEANRVAAEKEKAAA
jgi:hypothetical protein